MKSEPKSGHGRLPERKPVSAGELRWTAHSAYAVAFGLFLGLALTKFGNPVVLESKLQAPRSFSEFWIYAWPPGWAFWLLLVFVAIGAVLLLVKPPRWSAPRALWLLPLAWFGWQLVSATRTVDADLT